ncbi:dihydropteroate synthase [Jannaschia sp. S6380]|uniref:dihydropteroate synthase n=1 Tax=Jannaschia sp. S6380 TaxID=2926408 RepID=UPI001FF5E946|nr:dihydropteroate synthase [Jannaschia sp. S6380]MCK0165998.1 dihydropteroate synthase [Jannaschia sp. S6380]
MTYVLPLPARHATGPRLAGGWCRFDHVAMLDRGAEAQIVPAASVPDAALAPLCETRPPIAGVPCDRPSIMGILNVTPDSFSDGGRFLDPDAAKARADAMAAADILDIGGESTRPGAVEVEVEVEAERVLPVIAALDGRRISIDTRKADVATAALQAGARLVNDVSAMRFDPEMATTVARTDAHICLMHSTETPATMQRAPRYDHVLFDVYDALADRIATAEAAGIPRARMVVDPGIGFGKMQSHNLTLLRNIALFHGLGVPILLGVSRKGFIGTLGHAPVAADRMPGTLAVTLAAVAQGVQMHRVHDVAEMAQGLALWRETGEPNGPVWN